MFTVSVLLSGPALEFHNKHKNILSEKVWKIQNVSKISGETMVEARTLKIVAGIGAAAFLGYCIYFDKKRRSAPDFREKLKGKS